MRVLIVDDEPPARQAIRRMLRPHTDVAIAGECEGGAEAIRAIAALAPDVVFLDVQMPEVDGFAVVEAAATNGARPHVVFVTAYDRYAVRAFEVQALDYLLKPFDRERFDAMLERVRHRSPLRPGSPKIEPAERFLLREHGRVILLCASDVDWIEAQGNYVDLHTGGHSHLFRESLASLESRLDPRHFRRIHRSAMVNLRAIRELRPCFHGEYEVLLHRGETLKLSRRYRENLEKGALGGL